MNNKELQLVTIGMPKDLKHTLRMQNGQWLGFGDVMAATNHTLPASFVAPAAAGINDQLHLVFNCNGPSGTGIFHAIRYGDGSWTRFSSLTNQDGYPMCVGIKDELHVVVIPITAGAVYHQIRFADGTWSNPEDIFSQTGSPTGSVVKYEIGYAAVATVSGDLHVFFIDNNSQLWHTRRANNGIWSAIENLTNILGFPGPVGKITAAGIEGHLHLVCGDFLGGGESPGGTIWHIEGYYEVFAGRPGFPEFRFVWSAVTDVKGIAGDHGLAINMSIAEVQDELQLVACFGPNTPNLWHTIRHQDGTWTPFGNVEKAATGQSGVLNIDILICAGVEKGSYPES
jgi:hypothetical protein